MAPFYGRASPFDVTADFPGSMFCAAAQSSVRVADLTARSAGFRCADFAFADDAFWTDRLRYTSDSDDSDFAARSPDEPFHVAWVACENRSFLPNGCRHHNGVNDIRRFGYA